MKAIALPCCALAIISTSLGGCASLEGAKNRVQLVYTPPKLTLLAVNTNPKEHLTSLHLQCDYQNTTGTSSFTYWIMYDQDAKPTASWTGTDPTGANDYAKCQAQLADFSLFDGCAYIKIDKIDKDKQKIMVVPYLWPFIYTKRIVVTASGTEFIVQNISDDDHLIQRVINVKIDSKLPVVVTSCNGGSVPVTDQDTYAEDILDNAQHETLKIYQNALTGDLLTLYTHVTDWKDRMCPDPAP